MPQQECVVGLSLILCLLLYNIVPSMGDKAVMYPRELDLEHGKPLNVTCVLNSEVTHITSSDMTMVLYDYDEDNGVTTKNLTKYVDVLNERTIGLLLPGPKVTESFLNQKDLRCVSKTSSTTLAHVYIHVGRPPRPIKDMTATLLDGEILIVEWHKRVNHNMKTSLTASYRSSLNNTFRNVVVRPGKDDVEHAHIKKYQIRVSLGEYERTAIYFIVKVKSSNLLGNISAQRIFYSQEIVEPSSVANLKESDKTAHSVKISWQSPNTDSQLVYRINCTKNNSKKTYKWLAAPQSQLSYEIKGLDVFELYNITLEAQMEGKERWSQARHLQITTSASVPDALPETSVNGYRIIEDKEVGSRKVVIYWNAIPPEHIKSEKILNYHVRVIRQGHRGNVSVTVGPEIYEAQLPLEWGQSYNVIVEGENKMGVNKTLSSLAKPIVIQSELETLPAPQNVTVFINGNKLDIRWNVEAGTEYTLCIRTKDGHNQWIENVTSPFLTKLEPNFMDHRYSVAATNGARTSGMAFSDHCFYNMTKEAKIQGITMSQEVGEVIFKFPAQGCKDNPGYIYGYLVRYHLSDEKGPVRQAVAPSGVREWTLGRLKEKKPYTLEVYALTVASQVPSCGEAPVSSPLSESFSITTKTRVGNLTTSMLLKIVIPLGILVLILVPIGAVCFFRSSRKKCQRALEKLKVKINTPSFQNNMGPVAASEEDIRSQITQDTSPSVGSLPTGTAPSKESNSWPYPISPVIGVNLPLLKASNASTGIPLMNLDPDKPLRKTPSTPEQTLLGENQGWPGERSGTLSQSSDGYDSDSAYTKAEFISSELPTTSQMSTNDASEQHVGLHHAPKQPTLFGGRRSGDGESSSSHNVSEDGSDGYTGSVVFRDPSHSIVEVDLPDAKFSSPANIWSPKIMASNLMPMVEPSKTSGDQETDPDYGYTSGHIILPFGD